MRTGVPDQRADGGSGRLVADRYLLFDVLGRGGMGVVWRAHDQLLDRPVAAKELRVAVEGDEDHGTRMRRAVREARAVARVPHPHVVGVHDLVESEDRLWIVMELVRGPSLAARVRRSGPLTPAHTARLGLQLLDALRAVHLAGTLHRDVKPANVLLRPDGSAVLTDFGIAALDDGELSTSNGQLVGSIEYMAPERATAQEAGPESDLWSLGATLVTVCGGQSPFRRSAYAATLHAVVYGQPALPERLGPLRPVVEALLRKAPGERPTADEVAAALRDVAAGEAPEAVAQSASVAASGGVGLASDAATLVVGGASAASPPGEEDTRIAPPGGFGDTTVSTAEPAPTPLPVHRAGPGQWLAATLAGAAALVAVAGGGLALAGVVPFQGDEQEPARVEADEPAPVAIPPSPAAATPQVASYTLVVTADQSWQPVENAVVRAGDTVTVRSQQGEWTVDRQTMPMTGPAGYDAETDRTLDFAAPCKVDPEAPFGTLMTRLADTPDAPVLAIGEAKTFKAGGAGQVQLRINDGEGCLDDNTGEISVVVEVTRAASGG
ncbi:protein kinase domain-containing protein [Streptomyces sp. ESR1.13]|uniref:serine/threonine-protein kinase n=1 Tax=Streptomyces TaxID=1883 RepID=UPI00201F7D28|nr:MULTISPECIES: serine/threonine-protein kinase [Streptomyces]MCL7370357.1 protein kinase [Streptomyces ardesiacus]